ncbi:hypothetical protein [Streptomyces sp. NPDC055134]
MSRRRPSFVFFVPDQVRADVLGAFGDEHVRTPHLDAPAAHGTPPVPTAGDRTGTSAAASSASCTTPRRAIACTRSPGAASR